ncbi:serine/threonine protein kinase [Schlesneria paludicola]|uniref:serine/threonine protein kinase n=1 Tax=Schlesneria paludicola TaxID=360056 RepID=UPI00029AFA9B|nr:serine/threonine-protein kinase [Schlesneria paludicola]
MTTCELQIDDLEDLVGRDLDGRYLLEEFIDRGGFGAVYKGTDRKFNQAVAVKVGMSSREFMKEARLAAEVKHNHIVQVTDFGSDNGLAYLVMEYLEGEDLEKLFKRQGSRLTDAQLLKFVSEVGDALAHAHDDNLIHRDLKPRNIILRGYSGKSGLLIDKSKFVLLDFGIAAKLDSEGTQRNHTQDGAGTAEYMAPELLSRQPRATTLSDIYAFGVILYQMMTGRVPFPQADSSHLALAECLSAIVRNPAPRFTEVNGEAIYPVELEELVLQCLEKDPACRPQSMAELRQRFLNAMSQIVPANEPQRLTDTFRTSARNTSNYSHFASGALPQSRPVVRPSQFPRGLLLAGAGMVVLLATLAAVALFVYSAGQTPAYPVLTYEHGHVYGQQVDESVPLQLELGGTIRLTYLIEGPPDDVVHFEQPTFPDGMSVQTTNGPVPNKSKCFTINWTGESLPTSTLEPIVLSARSASCKHPFMKTLRINVTPAK